MDEELSLQNRFFVSMKIKIILFMNKHDMFLPPRVQCLL